MAWLRKLPSGNWSAQVDCQGVRTSKTWDTKAKARAWATQIEAEIIARSRGQIVRRSLRQAFERYGGTKWERTRLAFLAGSLGFADKWLEDVTPDDFGVWRDRCMLALKGSTVNRDLNLMMAVLSRCRDEWGWLHKSPLTKFKRPKDPPPRTRVIHWSEVRALLRALGWSRTPPTTLQHEVGFAFLMSLHTAMRAGEVLAYRLNGRVARLDKTKNGDARDVPLSPRALRLHALCPAYTVTSGSLDALFRKARRRAGLEGFTFHDARATAITRLSQRVDVLTLARITGHRDPKTLMVYYRTTPEQIAGLLR
jgi:integrase